MAIAQFLSQPLKPTKEEVRQLFTSVLSGQIVYMRMLAEDGPDRPTSERTFAFRIIRAGHYRVYVAPIGDRLPRGNYVISMKTGLVIKQPPGVEGTLVVCEDSLAFLRDMIEMVASVVYRRVMMVGADFVAHAQAQAH